jgi:hypothetical protein
MVEDLIICLQQFLGWLELLDFTSEDEEALIFFVNCFPAIASILDKAPYVLHFFTDNSFTPTSVNELLLNF